MFFTENVNLLYVANCRLGETYVCACDNLMVCPVYSHLPVLECSCCCDYLAIKNMLSPQSLLPEGWAKDKSSPRSWDSSSPTTDFHLNECARAAATTASVAAPRDACWPPAHHPCPIPGDPRHSPVWGVSKEAGPVARCSRWSL